MMNKRTNCKMNTSVVVLLGVGVLLYVVIRIMFPIFSYSINKTDRFKVQALKQKIGDEYYLAITPLYDYPYNKIDVEVYGKFESATEEVALYKDYISQLYPIGESIDSEEELKKYLFFSNNSNLANGTLVSYNDAIYFISKGERRPFLGPEAFLRLGFEWKNVVDEESQVIATMAEGEKINFISSHPDGAILQTKQGNLFLVWNEERLPIKNNDLLEKVWKQKHVVNVDSSDANQIGVCGKQKITPKKFSCFVGPVEMTGDGIGHTYIFKMNQDMVQSSSDARVRFDLLGKTDLWVAKESLKRVKDNLHLKYGGYIF